MVRDRLDTVLDRVDERERAGRGGYVLGAHGQNFGLVQPAESVSVSSNHAILSGLEAAAGPP